MNNELEAVRKIHEKFSFKDNGGEDMIFRLSLLIEELGEIARAITKGDGDIAEEHADLLILLLGNCVSASIDIKSAFWRKIEKMERMETINRNGYTRITSGGK